MPRRIRLLMLPVLAAVLLAGCAAPSAGARPDPQPDAAAGFPFTVDNCGTPVTFEQPPEEVVAIKSTSIEMLLALGLEDRISGVAFPDGPYAAGWAPETEPPLISERVPGQEAVLALEPDLVYAGWESNLTSDGAGDRGTLHRLGINTLVSPAACQGADYQPAPLVWEDIWAEISLMGRVFDVPDAADTLVAGQQQRLAAVAPDSRGLTALWYSSGNDSPYVGAGSGNPQLVMDAVGLENVAADVPTPWASLSWEAVADADPEVIVLIDAAWTPADKKIAELEGNPATAALTAVRNRQYLILPFPAGEAGVRSLEAVETLQEQLAHLDVAP
ncbi:putative F420-0 ABC transporter substrate-binding protein [Arthrobacter sp. zg-Y859]|uniref:F420-0 ABC transporter substrate-binding protein n=1 Tax=Arthrobacter jinronghuae TaxID=2964609 RepID=A0ABT1NNZ8_9MICC|nr:putative F420-0 ABC transporter substrate-binding protein [Arthrobacter jinronghuae]MCQ1948762.1 putative F420-0 ABC transporter substrate-binding protein [Arthrobacter jinronghuae]UWX78426.1 putative F420-0 ABC transporter substrate-binding protein [Arthrobacter jinronghuae]